MTGDRQSQISGGSSISQTGPGAIPRGEINLLFVLFSPPDPPPPPARKGSTIWPKGHLPCGPPLNPLLSRNTIILFGDWLALKAGEWAFLTAPCHRLATEHCVHDPSIIAYVWEWTKFIFEGPVADLGGRLTTRDQNVLDAIHFFEKVLTKTCPDTPA